MNQRAASFGPPGAELHLGPRLRAGSAGRRRAGSSKSPGPRGHHPGVHGCLPQPGWLAARFQRLPPPLASWRLSLGRAPGRFSSARGGHRDESPSHAHQHGRGMRPGSRGGASSYPSPGGVPRPHWLWGQSCLGSGLRGVSGVQGRPGVGHLPPLLAHFDGEPGADVSGVPRVEASAAGTLGGLHCG